MTLVAKNEFAPIKSQIHDSVGTIDCQQANISDDAQFIVEATQFAYQSTAVEEVRNNVLKTLQY